MNIILIFSFVVEKNAPPIWVVRPTKDGSGLTIEDCQNGKVYNVSTTMDYSHVRMLLTGHHEDMLWHLDKNQEPILLSKGKANATFD